MDKDIGIVGNELIVRRKISLPNLFNLLCDNNLDVLTAHTQSEYVLSDKYTIDTKSLDYIDTLHFAEDGGFWFCNLLNVGYTLQLLGMDFDKPYQVFIEINHNFWFHIQRPRTIQQQQFKKKGPTNFIIYKEEEFGPTVKMFNTGNHLIGNVLIST